MMDPFDSFNPPSGTDAGPLNIIFKGVKKLGHTPARAGQPAHARGNHPSTMEREDMHALSLIHISEPTRRYAISYAVFCLKKKTYEIS